MIKRVSDDLQAAIPERVGEGARRGKGNMEFCFSKHSENRCNNNKIHDFHLSILLFAMSFNVFISSKLFEVL